MKPFHPGYSESYRAKLSKKRIYNTAFFALLELFRIYLLTWIWPLHYWIVDLERYVHHFIKKVTFEVIFIHRFPLQSHVFVSVVENITQFINYVANVTLSSRILIFHYGNDASFCLKRIWVFLFSVLHILYNQEHKRLPSRVISANSHYN